MPQPADPPPCSCPEPSDWCQRMRRVVPADLHAACQTSAATRRFLDSVAAAAKDKAPRRGPCKFLGERTGKEEDCPVCPGNTPRNVYACSHPAHAAGTVIPYCQKECPDWEPRAAAAAEAAPADAAT